ncbi:hypothetical protein B0A50_04675 [Salinomyces thailandicus]|uniref:Uncharacterized protein n=1 Tax=Salinomyces thailandicus TaxID=706561 RepID=A0A4U0TV66_9PEZI|nr:hypothetical protein B0A50_04675 [Salinomyces thailandica]
MSIKTGAENGYPASFCSGSSSSSSSGTQSKHANDRDLSCSMDEPYERPTKKDRLSVHDRCLDSNPNARNHGSLPATGALPNERDIFQEYGGKGKYVERSGVRLDSEDEQDRREARCMLEGEREGKLEEAAREEVERGRVGKVSGGG